MAETLTMEPNVEKTSIENLSADEQDSLKVGEQMQEAQDNLLACLLYTSDAADE